MAKTSTIASIILGASIGVALVKYYTMTEKEREAFWKKVKSITEDLLDDAENTVERVEAYIGEIKSKGENNLIEKLYVVKKMLKDMFKMEETFL
jgi:predicted RecB family endonuclease